MKFLKLLAAIAFSLFAAAAPAAEADPPAVIGRLNHVAGTVSFAPAQAPEDWAAATVNRPVTTGDRLWADSGGRAEMHMGSLAIRMDEQTSLDVLQLDDRGLQLRLAQGSANVRVRRDNQPVEIATPGGAVVLNRPGSYRVSVDPGGSATSVTVRRGGQAEVFAPNGSFLVSDGQQAMIGGSRQDLAAAPAPDDFDRWAGTRDQREDRIASTRYVPAEMTGYEDLDEYGTWQTVPQYGTVWRPRAVPAGWAPYRQGHWVWVAPWGWTWVDDAPWGFAPSHYGRWVWVSNHWAWAPGRIVERPVYAPAVVAFIGGSNFSVSIGVGAAPAVAWVPLGWREPYRPWYRASRDHVRNVNVTSVTNVTNITNITNVRLVNRNAPSAVTVVSRENFVAARPVRPVRVSQRTIAAAPVARSAPVAAPERTSLAQARAGARPPAEVRSRETVAVNTPPAPARNVERADRKGKGRDEARAASRDNDDRPRVRVIDRQQRRELQASQAPAAQPQAKGGERGQDKAALQAQGKAPTVDTRLQAQGAAPQPQAQGKAPPVEAKGNERAQNKGAPQAQGKAQNKAQNKDQERAASQPQPATQAERRAPAPPADVAKRPTFDRDMRQVAPQADAKRGERRAEREQRREQKSNEAARPPQAQVAPQPDNRAGRSQGPDARRARQQGEERAREQQAQEQRARDQQEQQRGRQQAQQERQRQQQVQEQQAQRDRRQAESRERAQEAQQHQAQQQAREQAQEQAQQRAQEQAQQRAKAHAQEQAQQRAQEQARQRTQQQAQQTQQRAREQAQEQARARAQEQAQQRAKAHAQEQAQQRAQQQAQQQAREQQAQQRAQQQAQQRAQQQAQRQQQQAQRAQQQAQQQAQARQQRRDQAQEKGGRERPQKDKDKADKG